jgi:zinc-ribbon domain
MVCSQCGTKLVQNSIYCSSCGTNLKNKAASPPTSSSQAPGSQQKNTSTSNQSPNLGIDKKKLKNWLFLAMSMDGFVLVSTITAGNPVGMMFSTLFLAIVFYVYKNLQQNNYSEAKNYCLAGALLNGFFAFSNIAFLHQITVIPIFLNELTAAMSLMIVYQELNSKVKD